MNRPTAIYRPATRALLLASANGYIELHEDHAATLTAALRRTAAFFDDAQVRGSLSLSNDTGRVTIPAADLTPFADAIDVAFATRDLAVAMLAGATL